jgi:hypothetical protein
MTRLVLQDASLLDGDTAARRATVVVEVLQNRAKILAVLKGGGLVKDNLEKRYGLR